MKTTSHEEKTHGPGFLIEYQQLSGKMVEWMGDRLVGCASYTMSEFHVRNYMARRPHINQEPNVGTSAVAIMCAELIECHTSGQTKEEYPVWKSSTSLSETSPL